MSRAICTLPEILLTICKYSAFYRTKPLSLYLSQSTLITVFFKPYMNSYTALLMPFIGFTYNIHAKISHK